MKDMLSFNHRSQESAVRINLCYYDGVQIATNSVPLVFLAPLDVENPTSCNETILPYISALTGTA